MKRLVKTVNIIDDFDVSLFNELNIGVEIQDFVEPNLSMKETVKLMDGYRKKLKGFKNIKSLHGPFLDLKPASPDLKIREVSYKRYLNALFIGSQLDLDYVIFHSQINPYLNQPFLKRLNNKQSKEFWQEILKQTKYQGSILIENIFEETPDMLKEYIETIHMPNVKINLDIGHAKLGKASLEEWIASLKDHIEYIHVHSNDGLHDEHKPLSGDEIDNLLGLLKKYNLDPVLSLEYKTDNLKDEINRYI